MEPHQQLAAMNKEQLVLILMVMPLKRAAAPCELDLHVANFARNLGRPKIRELAKGGHQINLVNRRFCDTSRELVDCSHNRLDLGFQAVHFRESGFKRDCSFLIMRTWRGRGTVERQTIISDTAKVTSSQLVRIWQVRGWEPIRGRKLFVFSDEPYVEIT